MLYQQLYSSCTCAGVFLTMMMMMMMMMMKMNMKHSKHFETCRNTVQSTKRQMLRILVDEFNCSPLEIADDTPEK